MKKSIKDATDNIVVEFIPAGHWWCRTKWELKEDYVSKNGHVIVPAGFITDGASIPMIMRWLFSPTGRYFSAAIIHDYIIIAERDWPKANKEFEAELLALQIKKWRTWVLMKSVTYWSTFLSWMGVNSASEL